MTIVSIKAGTDAGRRRESAGSGRDVPLRIELSDGSFFWFKVCYLPPVFVNESLLVPGLAEGQEISAAEEMGLRSASACLRAERAALRLIARAEQCLFGLRRKLEKRGHEPACVGVVVARLAELELVDDRRFARLWLETRLRRTASPRRLLAGLRARGIARDDAEKAVNAVLDNDAEFELLRRFTVKLQRTLANVKSRAGDYHAARNIKFSLKNEGFSPAVIQRFLLSIDN
jgi:regulatory protein